MQRQTSAHTIFSLDCIALVDYSYCCKFNLSKNEINRTRLNIESSELKKLARSKHHDE